MSSKIVYDFNLSKTVCDNLEEVVRNLNTCIIFTENDNLRLIANSWESQSTELYVKKYIGFVGKVKNIRNELSKEIEEIKRTSRKIYLIEQEAKKKASEEGN